MMTRQAFATAAVVLLPAFAHAQTVRGVIVDRSEAPVAGVVVTLLDSASNVAGRALSNERGEYGIRASAAGSYRLRTQRIGFRPVTSPAVILSAGADVTRRLALSDVPVSLAAVRVVANSACHMAADSATATFAAWEQIRTALTAAQLTANARAIVTTTVAYERLLDRDFKHVRQQRASVNTELVTKPWRELPTDSLHAAGYVAAGADDSTTYYAPGLDALLSNVFVEDHCFRLTAADDTSRLGIAFEPTRVRRRVPEIAGTLWLDRASAELRDMDFHYVNVPRVQGDRAGGMIEFVRLRDGTWTISRWNVAMPVIAVYRWLGAPEPRAVGLKTTGGELAVARRGSDTLWARPPIVLAGTVVDSASGAPVPLARISLHGTDSKGVTDTTGHFSIAGVMPGEYTLEVRTLSLDSLGGLFEAPLIVTDGASPVVVRAPTRRLLAIALCGKPRFGQPFTKDGILVGHVSLRGDTVPPAGAVVTAEWGRAGSVSLEATTDSRGAYHICGVGVDTRVEVTATLGRARSTPLLLRIPSGARLKTLDLVMDQPPLVAAAFAGAVITDSTRKPVADADVTLPELALNALTNDRGEFRFTDIPAGTHLVKVRRVGYLPLDVRLEFPAKQTVHRELLLTRIARLDSLETGCCTGARGGPRNQRRE
jgi:hypothetical protein